MSDNQCIGIMGKYFGHCYKKYLAYKGSSTFSVDACTGHPDDIKEMADKYRNEKYKIVCKRCGNELKNEEVV
jgi:hypothetical protein